MDTAGELGAPLLTAGRCAEPAPLVEESWKGFRKVLPPSHPYLVRADDWLRRLQLRCASPVEGDKQALDQLIPIVYPRLRAPSSPLCRLRFPETFSARSALRLIYGARGLIS